MNVADARGAIPVASAPERADVADYQSLVRDHRGAPRSFRSRIETAIFDWRPSYRCPDGTLPDGLPPPRDLDARHVAAMRDIVARYAPSVGLVEVESDSAWKPVCTCFLVTVADDKPARVLTAGHALLRIMAPGSRLRDWVPLKLSRPARKVRVRFATTPGGGDMEFPLELRWAHPAWDMLLGELAGSAGRLAGREALALHADADDGMLSLEHGAVPICVLGYPMRDRGDGSEVFDDLDTAAPELRAAPGLLRTLPSVDRLPFAPAQPLATTTSAHDASTLPGSSGSPVFGLDGRKVIGLHFDGGTHRELASPPPGLADVFDPNRAIHLPLALSEPFVQSQLSGAGDASDVEPHDWSRDFPRWSAGALPAEGQLELDAMADPREDASPMLRGVVPDRFDARDRVYRPSLLEARDVLLPPDLPARMIRDQRHQSACTAFALAAAINMQLCKLGRSYQPVSERMLYELARLYDEWIDDSAEGTSLRAVIKAFYQNGVCLERTSPYIPGERRWTLTRQAAKEARAIALGAYYRLQPDLLDFQLALLETGAIIVSAHVHPGWLPPEPAAIESIRFERERRGAHAFVVVGYDRTGFIIQNSWGKGWGNWHGQPGLAHWTYEDWAENLIDAWVLRLAPSTPEAFDLVPRVARESPREDELVERGNPVLLPTLPRPRRFSLIGHTVQLEHDRVIDRGRLGMGLDSVRETALYLGSRSGREKYKSLALLFHDPHMNADTLLRLCMLQSKEFMARGIYPLHVNYGLDEGYTIRLRSQDAAERVRQLTARSGEPVSAYLDRRARDVLFPLYRSFRRGLGQSTRPGEPLWQVLSSIVLELDPKEQTLCMAADGLGSVVAEAAIGLIEANAAGEFGEAPISTERLFLLAPCCSVEEIASRPLTPRVWSLKSSSREAAVRAGFEGFWPDLAMVAGHDRADVESAIRGGEALPGKPWHAGSSAFETLHEACADPRVLNDCLAWLSSGRDA